MGTETGWLVRCHGKCQGAWVPLKKQGKANGRFYYVHPFYERKGEAPCKAMFNYDPFDQTIDDLKALYPHHEFKRADAPPESVAAADDGDRRPAPTKTAADPGVTTETTAPPVNDTPKPKPKEKAQDGYRAPWNLV